MRKSPTFFCAYLDGNCNKVYVNSNDPQLFLHLHLNVHLNNVKSEINIYVIGCVRSVVSNMMSFGFGDRQKPDWIVSWSTCWHWPSFDKEGWAHDLYIFLGLLWQGWFLAGSSQLGREGDRRSGSGAKAFQWDTRLVQPIGNTSKRHWKRLWQTQSYQLFCGLLCNSFARVPLENTRYVQQYANVGKFWSLLVQGSDVYF